MCVCVCVRACACVCVCVCVYVVAVVVVILVVDVGVSVMQLHNNYYNGLQCPFIVLVNINISVPSSPAHMHVPQCRPRYMT